MNTVRKANKKYQKESYSPKKGKPEILNMVNRQQRFEKLERNVLEKIPYMGYGNPSAVCYIGSVMRLMDYLEDPIEVDELFSLSGTALCFPWKAGICCDEVSILPEIPQLTFSALGYEYEYIYEPNIDIEPHLLDDKNELMNGQPKMTINPRKHSKDFYMDKIKNSIDDNHPVIGFGFTELNYTCLITGYDNGGNGLYLRAYWSPEGTPEGYDREKYFYTEDWYKKCCGLVIIGDKNKERLTGEKAYRHIQRTAKIFKEKQTECTQGEVIYNGFSAFDDMVSWLLNDNWWHEDCDFSYREMLFKQCGVLLFNHYRSYLHHYLGRLSEQYSDLINPEIRLTIEHLRENVSGADHSQLHLDQCVDPAITDFSMMHNRDIRKKVTKYIEKLKEIDKEIFDCILK